MIINDLNFVWEFMSMSKMMGSGDVQWWGIVLADEDLKMVDTMLCLTSYF